MDNYSLRVWTLIALITSLLFAPVARASMCPRQLPSRYVPVLRLPEPIKHKVFDIRETWPALELRNLSRDAMVLVAPADNKANAQIKSTGTFVIDIHNAGIYTANIRNESCGNGGIPDGQPVPQNIPTRLSIRIGQETVSIPVDVVYESNPHYARELRDYQEYEKRQNSYDKAIVVLGIVYFVGYAALVIAGIVGAIFLLRWMLRRAEERWE